MFFTFEKGIQSRKGELGNTGDSWEGCPSFVGSLNGLGWGPCGSSRDLSIKSLRGFPLDPLLPSSALS